MNLRLAVVVSHPIQHFAPWHREVARLEGIDLRVFFCCDWGLVEYTDPQFQMEIKWDVPLLEGYDHEFLPIDRRPARLGFWEVDNPAVGDALDRFNPDVTQVFGYARRTNWRVSAWSRRKGKPLMLYSDSNLSRKVPLWKRIPKEIIVRYFYSRVDGALFVGDNNFQYHRYYGLPTDRLFPGVLPIDRDRLTGAISDRKAARRDMRRKLGIPDDAFVLMFCGKYVPHKRPLDLVAAAWEVAKSGKAVWSLLVGDGPERGAIESFCAQEGVRNSTLTGFVNQSKIADYYAASDAIAVTSSQDAHPLVVSEGASFGLPVIVSDKVGCIGASDVARPGLNAVIYPCGDRRRLERAIESLCLDKDLYGKMSTASVKISEAQDVRVAARALAEAATALKEMGPR
jgi:glycosyltransferase involved in cell wall biosynthesis